MDFMKKPLNRKDRQPKNPFHPGEILLEEFLEPGKITQSKFATELGWTKAKLNEFIKGKAHQFWKEYQTAMYLLLL